ncbi:MFS transporter [Chloroflexota bacterium]
MKNFNRFSLWVILASATLTVMAGAIISPVLNLMRDGLGVDPASVGFIITTHALFLALFSPLIGNLVDRIGARKPLMFGLLLYGVAGGSGLFITSYWVLILSRAVLGIAVAAIFVSITVMILNLYKGDERNKVMGWRGSANSFGGIIWPLIGGVLGGYSWHLPFAVYLLGLPAGLLALIAVPEVHQEKTDDAGEKGSVLMVFRDNPILYAIYGLRFLTMLLLFNIVVFGLQLLEKVGISNPSHIALFMSGMGISAGLTSLMYGKIKSRLSYKTIVLITLALWTISFAMISQASSGWVMAASITLYGIGHGMILPAVMVWAGEIGPVSFRGRIVSYLGISGHIGQFLSPVIFSPAFLFLGLNGVFLVAGGICALLFLLFLFGMRR